MSYEYSNYGQIDRFFGGDKSDFEPPPAPPPQGMTMEQIRMRPVPKDPKLYKQDPKCPTRGEITAVIPCVGADCDPGEMEADCVDDPIYATMMEQYAKSPQVKITPTAPRTTTTPPPEMEPIDPEDMGSALENLRALIAAKRARLGGYNPNPYFRGWDWF